MKIDEKTMNEYELYIKLRDKFTEIYDYRWETDVGSNEWLEATDKLSDIMFKKKHYWSGKVEIIEEV